MHYFTATGSFRYAYLGLRYLATVIPRTRLHFLTREIGKRNEFDAGNLREAIGAHHVYLELQRRNPRGYEASEFFHHILNTYHISVVKLARSSSLIRHGLLRGSLTCHEYDIARNFCRLTPGGEALAPFFSRIERLNRWRSQE